MKDFETWAAEYQREANALNERVKKLRVRLQKTCGSENREMKRRIAMLYTMYLECRNVAIVLEHHPAARWEERKRERMEKQAASWERKDSPNGLIFFEQRETGMERGLRMEHKFVNFASVERVLGVGDGLPEFLRDSDEDREYRRMVRVLRRAMEGELTQRQKRCLELYYFEGKTMEETGRELGIWKSTVSRHLKKARRRVEEILRYSSDRLAP